MYDGSSLATPPRDSELENEKTRGQLLHFLANHAIKEVLSDKQLLTLEQLSGDDYKIKPPNMRRFNLQ